MDINLQYISSLPDGTHMQNSYQECQHCIGRNHNDIKVTTVTTLAWVLHASDVQDPPSSSSLALRSPSSFWMR